MTASRRGQRIPLLAIATVVGAGTVAGLPATASAAEPARCDATSLQLSLVGSDAIAPVRANQAFTPCATDAKSVANLRSVLGILGAQAVSASTKVDKREQTVSDSRIAGARVAVTGPLTDALTGPLLNGPGSIVGQVDGAINGITGPLTQPGGLLSGLVSLFGGFEITGIDGAPVRAGLTSNLAGALQATLPDVLNAGVLQATAQAKCVNGKAQLSGTSRIADLRVLGTAVDANDTAGRVLSIDTARLNLGRLVTVDDVLRGIRVTPNGLIGNILRPILGGETTLYDLLRSTDPTVIGQVNRVLGQVTGGLTAGAFLQQLTDVIQPVLDRTTIALPAGLLRAQVIPTAQAKAGELLTQQTLGINVTALGQPVLGGTLATARVSSASAACANDAAGGGAGGGDDVGGGGAVKDPDKYGSAEAEAVLECTNRPATLIDVYGSNGRTYVQGVAVRRFAGKTATIYSQYGNKRVGKAKIRKSGLFSTRVALPPAKIRNTNRARYFAVVGGKKTRALKFARRMKVTTLSVRKGRVTMAGQVVAPRFGKQPTVLIKQRISCKRYKSVARVRPNAKGGFRVTFKAPSKKLGAAIYRAETSVPANRLSTKPFRTYTLPRVVGL